jgi:hypothetical protein
MKKIFTLLLPAFIMLFMGCSKELDLPSETSLDATKTLKPNDVESLLIGVYEKITNPSDNGYFQIMYPEILSDNLLPVKFQWFQVKDAYQHNVLEDDILNTYGYVNFYSAIKRANTILVVPSVSDELKAKARYCRAYSYLRLIDLYGDVPKIDETYKNNPIARSKESEIIDFIIEDLKYAKQYGPKIDEGNLATAQTLPTSEAAQALLARVYRIKGDMKNAGIEAEELIKGGKFQLTESPSIENRTPEVIMRFVSVKGKGNAEWGWICSWEASTWNCFAVSTEVLDLMGPDDTRRELYDFNDAAEHKGYVFSKKYQLNSDADLLVSRLAEMYLISAEAGNANRLTELQAIRKSKGLTLAEERRLELALEWLRWRDLRLQGEKYVIPIPLSAKDSNPLLK